jgi:tRNA A-37 threonylcarbamoyl transferase component Bud32
VRTATASGRAFAPFDQELLERVSAWLVAGSSEEGEALKEGRVWRIDDRVLKLYPRERGLYARLRAGRALRASLWHFRLLPTHTPAPILALRATGRAAASEALLSQYIAGATLLEPEGRTAEALAAFSRFLADMHRRHLLHGDLHARNALWDGADWWLLDLDGMRNPLHRVRQRSVLLRTWARLAVEVGDPELARELHEGYVRALGRGAHQAPDWEHVRSAAARHPLAARTSAYSAS